MKYEGSCHCGKIAYEVEGNIDSVMECNCSICSRRGYLLWFVPRDQVTFKTPMTDLTTYTFNKHVIKHQFCPTCGCAPINFGIDGQSNEIAAINVRCIQTVDISKLKINHYDGRSA